jgi:hypothetical protein
MGAKVEEAMRRAEKIETRELKADTDDLERDAQEFGFGGPTMTPAV